MSAILIIEDDERLCDALCRSLRKRKHCIQIAHDGEQGLSLLAAVPADLVLLDIFMPHRDGLETLAYIRRAYPNLKVIAMSGGGRKGEVEILTAARLMGATRTLVKPFESWQLINAIDELLGVPQCT